ncbi:MAG: hypothetical protein LBQ77_07985 [Treponema sp.]|jgi:hypothetical protein|nr:hypothetical protein [Treponema sp.]
MPPKTVTVSKNSAEVWIQRAIIGTVVITVIVVFAMAINQMFHLPVVINIRGSPGIDRKAFLDSIGMDPTTTFSTVNSLQLELAIRKRYHFESVQILKRYPNMIDIILHSRDPVALSLIYLDEKTVPVYFDDDGVIVQIGGKRSELLPIISGISAEEVSIGDYLIPPEFATFLPNLDTIRYAEPELLSLISEIRIESREYGYDLIVYPVNHKVRIRMNSNINKETLQYVLLLAEIVVSQGIDAEEIDFRSGRTASYRRHPFGER